jgi:hypothetical protein
MERSTSRIHQRENLTDPRRKGNQSALHEGITACFLVHLEHDFARIDVFENHIKETAHSGIDERSYYLCEVQIELPNMSR